MEEKYSGFDVRVLMERIRSEQARSANRGALENLSVAAARPLSNLADLEVGRIDSKSGRVQSILARAMDKTRVRRRVPKLLRRLFRKQGGYNELVLEALSVLSKVQDGLIDQFAALGATVASQNTWLGELRDVHDSQRKWIKAASAAISLVERERDASAAARADSNRRLDSLEATYATWEERFILSNQKVEEAKTTLEGIQRHFQQETKAVLESIQRQFQEELHALYHALSRLDDRVTADTAFFKAEISRHSRGLDALQPNETSLDHLRPAPNKKLHVKFRGPSDALYVRFEDTFRGPRDQIKHRLASYLPYITKVSSGRRHGPVLDLGCGRGEWLELLREQGLEAHGVDINSAMVALCKSRGLQVNEEGAVEYLRTLKNGSHRVITGFHIIEHLSLDVLLTLIAEVHRVLEPNGLAIFETPNCKNLVVGACNFYIDPTHRNPVFPETAQFLLSFQGFEPVELQYLNPVKNPPFTADDNDFKILEELLYGAQDFAVIGYKPGKRKGTKGIVHP